MYNMKEKQLIIRIVSRLRGFLQYRLWPLLTSRAVWPYLAWFRVPQHCRAG